MHVLIFAVVGAALGSFLAWLGRELMDRKEFAARSACDACRRKLAWYEMIPVVSYLGLGGRCRSCGVEILIADWSMEIVGAILFGLGALRFGVTRDLVWWLLVAFFTMLLFYIDVRWMVVPRAFSVVVAFTVLLAQITPGTSMMILLTALLGAIFYFFLYAVSNGEWVGDGDVALGFIVGAAAGTPEHLGVLLLLAHVFGAAVALVLLKLKKRQLGDPLPMGAFLLPALWVIVLYFGWFR